MQSLQANTEEAENLLYHAKKRVPKFGKNAVSNGKQISSLYQKLAEIRKEELRSTFSLADPLIEQNHIRLTDSSLIEKLVKKESLNTLIFNLYPANRGYSLSVIVRSDDNGERMMTSLRLPYTEEQLFSYLDNEEIPPLLCQMLDNCVVQLYYNGCIIAEIRDYRKSPASSAPHYVKHHILLRQTAQTIVNDVNEAIGADSNFEDSLNAKLELEKTLILANYGPLCLTPKPSIAIALQKLHYSKHFFNTHKLKFKARKHTLLGIAHRKRQEQFSKCSPAMTSLAEFITKKKKTQALKSKKVPKTPLPECPDSENFRTVLPRTISQAIERKEQRELKERQKELAEECPQEGAQETKENGVFDYNVIEEYVIETKDDAGLQFTILLTISQRIADYEYVGEVQQSREQRNGEFHKISYSFPLGTLELARRYVLEFTNVYTERGKINIKFTHKVPRRPSKSFITSGLRMEGDKLVPIESKSLELDTTVSLETFSTPDEDPKAQNSIPVASKFRPSGEKLVLTSQGIFPNVLKQLKITSSDQLIPNQVQVIPSQQSLPIQVQHQLQQQLLQHKRQLPNQLQQQRNAIVNLKAQVQEHLQMRQTTNVVNGVISQNVPQYSSLLQKKENISVNVPSTSQNLTAHRTVTTVIPKVANSSVQYQTANNEVPISEATATILTNSSNITAANGNNSAILSLLANTSAQSSPSSSTANITLTNLLTSAAGTRTFSAGQTTVNVAGQRVVAKRLKMPSGATAARVISGNQTVTTNFGNATVIAAAPSNVAHTSGTVNAQSVIRLSLSSLQNQTTPVVQQRGTKSLSGRIITPSQLKNASLMNSLQPVTVTSSGSIQIGNNVHTLATMQTLLGSSSVGQTATGIRMKAANRRNVVVSSLQSLQAAVNTSNGQLMNDTTSQTINCAKIQTIAAATASSAQGGLSATPHLSSGELQTIAGTLTAAPTIGTIQLTRNVQTLPAGSVHVVTSNHGSISNSRTINVTSKGNTLNSIHLSANAEGLIGGPKGPKIMRLSSHNPETNAQSSVGFPVSTLSALLSAGAPISDGAVSSPAKSNVNLERINQSLASTSHTIATANPNNATIDLTGGTPSNRSLNVQNVQVSIPGMAVPITLSLNVGDQNSNSSYLDALSQNAQITSLPNVVGTSVILTNSNAGNSVKTSTLRPVSNATALANVQGGTLQQLQLIGSVQRAKLGTPIAKPGTARSLLNTSRVKLVPPPNAVVQQQPGGQGQMLSVTAQQQLQMALQKQAAQLQLHQGLTAAGGLKVAQKRRRSSVATDSN